jgi:hypothetical protein
MASTILLLLLFVPISTNYSIIYFNMHAFYTLLSYYIHIYIIHLLSLTMHGLGTGNTLLTAAAAAAASRSKALI